MISIHKEIVLYERIQAGYDSFIAELVVLNQEQQFSRIHELRIKTLVLELIINEMYPKDELEYLLTPDGPLRILHERLLRYILKSKIYMFECKSCFLFIFNCNEESY